MSFQLWTHQLLEKVRETVFWAQLMIGAQNHYCFFPAVVGLERKSMKGLTARPQQRLTFPFPFVHHQPHDWKVETH